MTMQYVPTESPADRPLRARQRHRGFTLLEIVIAITILATVLTLAYTILSKILETELEVSKRATPEKIGNGILAAIRKDFMSAVYQDLGPIVFVGESNGERDTAFDTVSFFTTVPPVNPDTLGGQFDEFNNPDTGGMVSETELLFTGVTAVTYFLRETADATESNIYTLFRRESIGFVDNPQDPFDSPGISYELYDKILAIDFDYFDGYDWFPDWHSHDRLEEEYEIKRDEAELALDAKGNVAGAITAGGNRATRNTNDSDTSRTRINARSNEVDEVESLMQAKEQFYNAIRPPVAIPVAVRVQITFLAGDEKGVYEEKESVANPDLEQFTFSTVVPLLTGMRVPLISEEEFLGEAGVLGMDGEEGSYGDFTGTTGAGGGPGGSSRGSGSSNRR